MSTRKTADRPRTRRGRAWRVEVLEGRALMAAATETFNAPSLTDLIHLAREGENTAQAGINRMLQALQSQLTSGPLADLKAGTVNGTEFVTEVQSLVTSFEQNVDQQLLPEFPNVDKIIKLQGQSVVAQVTALNQQNSVGLISSSELVTQSQTAINSLTAGPLLPLHTPLSALAGRTKTFETDLNTLVQSLNASASPSLTLAQVNTTLQAEAAAYRASIDAAISVTHPNIAAMVDSAVTTLENQSNSIAQTGGTNAQSQLQAAITTFDNTVLDVTGIFGPAGVFSRSLRHDSD
jgi:hypothetical protein